VSIRQNVGTPDRAARIVIAAVLAVAAVGGFVTGPLAILAAVAAAVMLVTGLTGFCPLYALFRVSTCPVRR
jgi:hypothetical protein